MTPTDDKGVHTHDFRETVGRCICGELSEPKEKPVLNIDVPETDWKAYAADYLSGDPERLKQHLPEWMRDSTVNIHVAYAPDMEVRAELFNEGFDTAHKQGVGGELSYAWLVGKLEPILGRLRGTIKETTIDDMITKIADEILDDSLLHDADSDERPDQQRGMYGKYFVERLHDPEGKHKDDRFFVLDPVHDPCALSALKTYAAVCRSEYPKLADDLRAWINDLERRD